jgi:hypothetical protein
MKSPSITDTETLLKGNPANCDLASRPSSWLRRFTSADLLSVALLILYLYYFLWGNSPSARGIAQYWFHPDWVTDDSTQQTYPFIRAIRPGAFENDFVSRMMFNYIPPLHYWLGFCVTLLSKDPVMTGHWLMLIQLSLTACLIYAAVRHLTGSVAPAVFAVVWLIHTRHIVQRITAGIPRGWAAPMIAAFLFLAVRGSHRGVMGLIAIGCLIHPPSVVAICLAYGMYLLWGLALPSTRLQTIRPFIQFCIVGPIFIAITAWAVAKPKEFGNMATYEEALSRPEFSAREPRGRFPFVPFKPALREVSSFALQSFHTPRLYDSPQVWKIHGLRLVTVLALALAIVGAMRRVTAFPVALLSYGLASGAVYVASRIFAFKLFVPDRHLQFPFAILFIIAFSSAVWRVVMKPDWATKTHVRGANLQSLKGFVGLSLLALVIYSGSGTGLYGPANFNYHRLKRGNVFEWVKVNTPPDSLIAGEPTFLDPVQLFGERKGFITSETAHPFYSGYWQEAKRRLELSLRANYAKSAAELIALVEPERISYFIFDRASLSGDRLKKVKYYAPFNILVRELAQHAPESYLGRQLVSLPADARRVVVPYIDDRAIVVDIQALRKYEPQLASVRAR